MQTIMEQLSTIKAEHPTSWKLIRTGDSPTEVEEVVLRLQGIISNKDLPPLTMTPK